MQNISWHQWLILAAATSVLMTVAGSRQCGHPRHEYSTFNAPRKQDFNFIMYCTLKSRLSTLRRLAFGAAAFAAFSCYEPHFATAQQTNWTNNAGGLFGDAANWDAGVPSGVTEATFSLGGTYQVDVSSESKARNVLVDNGDVTFFGKDTLSTSWFNVSDASTSFTNGVSFNNSDAFTVSSVNGTNANLTIESGATGNSERLDLTGSTAGSASVLVTGTGSELTLSQYVRIGGFDHFGSLAIADGGKLNSQHGFIGSSAGSQGSLDVTGAGSRWTLSSALGFSILAVGADGQGVLNVSDGGKVGGADSLRIGSSADGQGIATISGDNSSLESTQAVIGEFGDGTLRVLNGGTVQTAGTASIGAVTGGTGFVEVAGQGASRSQWNAANLYLGTFDGTTVAGTGMMQVDSEGIVQVGNDTAFAASGSGLSVGDSASSGNLLIRNGSSVEVASDTYIGRNDGFSGIVSLSGDGSKLKGIGSTTLSVGHAGTGTLQIQDRALVEYSRLEVGNTATGDGNVSIDNASLGLDHATVGSTNGGLATIDIINGGGMFAESLTMRGSSANQVNLDGRFSTLQVESLSINGGVLNIDGLARATATRTTIGSNGSVFLDGGTFDSGVIDRSSFDRISGTSGTVRGSLRVTGYNDINDLEDVSIENLDTAEIRYGNSGVIFGDGISTRGMDNLNGGEVRVAAGQWQRWGPGNSNTGQINVIDGTVEFEADFQNRGQFFSDTRAGSINLFDGTLRVSNNLFNDMNAFIGGRGRIIAGAGINNRGVMAFSGGNTDIIGDVENNNLMSQIITSGNGTTTFFDDVEHNGAEIRTSEGSATVFLGAVSGNGDFTGTGNVFFEGDLRPGNSPDVVSFEGGVFFSSSLTSNFELAGLELGDFDKLEIAGDLSLGGNLVVDLLGDFQLGLGDEFLIAETAGNVSGQFIGLSEGDLVGSFGGTDLFITYSGGNGNDVGLFTAIPEPASMTFASLMLVGCAIRRRRA